MLEGLKRWFGGRTPSQAHGWEDLAPWAQQRQYTFRGVREAEGFVIEGRLGALPWRLEWGPSQRHYIQGPELRIRSELGLPSELQAVVLNRPLKEQMEKAVFDQYVEGVQTRIDNETPPEMRWLVMFPPLAGGDMQGLKDRWVALGSIKPWVIHWLEGPLGQALGQLDLDPKIPVVLIVGRGRLSLRVAQPLPEPRDLQRWVGLFETAMREGRRVATATLDSGSPSTQPSLWTASALPTDEQRKP